MDRSRHASCLSSCATDRLRVPTGWGPGPKPGKITLWEFFCWRFPKGALRWSYVLGLDLLVPVSVTPRDLGVAPGATLLAWEHDGDNGWPASVVVVTAGAPLWLPATGEPLDATTISASFHVLAPVLSNGWAFLGEPGKIVAASRRRVSRVEAAGAGMVVGLRGCAGEEIAVAVQRPPPPGGGASGVGNVEMVRCEFGPGPGDRTVTVVCADATTCICS